MKPVIDYEDFAKVEMRIGTVVEAEVPDGSKSVVKLEVDFGEEIGKRVIFAGIKQWYEPDQLKGKQLPFVVNLKAKKIGDWGESQGMLLAGVIENDEGRRAMLLSLEGEVDDGTKVG